MIPIKQNVGVVIPVYNRPTLLKDTLDSVAAQTVLPGQVIVVDDGSTDNTAKAVENWIENLKIPLNIRLVSTENRGISSARNHGLDILKNYEFISFLDSDDIWPECYIERMTQLFRDNDKAVAVSCDKVVKSEGNLDILQPISHISHDPTSYIIKKGAGNVSSSMFRSKSIFEAGTFDESLKAGEDAALFLPISVLGSWLYLPDVQVVIRRHNLPNEESNISRNSHDCMLIWGGIYDSFIIQIDTDNPKLKKWKLNISACWLRFSFAMIKKFSFADSLYCLYRSVFWVFSSLKH